MLSDSPLNDRPETPAELSKPDITVAYLVPEKPPEGNLYRKMTFYVAVKQETTDQTLYSYGVSPVKHDQDFMDKLNGVYRLPEPIILKDTEHPFIDSKSNIVVARYDKDEKLWVDFHPTGQALEF